ncbi:MAG: hypothetical protein ACR2PA_07020 [Hyphomicrobiaceae bacterium]
MVPRQGGLNEDEIIGDFRAWSELIKDLMDDTGTRSAVTDACHAHV